MKLTARSSLTGKIEPTQTLVSKVSIGGFIKIEPEHYTDEHEVTPKTTPQILYTSNKFLVDDIVVHKIPFHEVSNGAGGTTITIGKEV